MPNAKFMIKTYRCGEAEAIEKFDSWVEAEGLDPEAEACKNGLDDGAGTAKRPMNREQRRAKERRDRKIKKRQARKAASENDAALQSQDMGKEETEMQKVSKVNGRRRRPRRRRLRRRSRPSATRSCARAIWGRPR